MGEFFGGVLGMVAFMGFGMYCLRALLATAAVSQQHLDVGSPAPRALEKREAVRSLILGNDPAFSLVLFEDFAYALYAESQRSRHDPKALSALAPYLAKAAMATLTARPPKGGRVRGVVVGALAPGRVFADGNRIRLEYSFETNLHIGLEPSASRPGEPTGLFSSLLPEMGPATQGGGRPVAITQYVEETWTFSRDLRAKTRPQTSVRRLGCPNCGAPLKAGDSGRCEACGEAAGAGQFDWQVVSAALDSLEARSHSLTGNTEEVGTDESTRFAASVRPTFEALLRDDPGLSLASIEARLRLIFTIMQSSWSAQDLRPLRPFVSDRQFDYLQYWIEAYQEQGLRNLMARPWLQRFVVARVERDACYDALTLRVWASGCDYTVETKTDKMVGGSRTSPRRYSEYWTLIRSAKTRGAARADLNCPGCGAPLKINMAGACEHCTSHLTSGEFDWVLSKIEQDESYQR